MTEHTPGPWSWTIHDSSAATLHGADDMLDHVLTVSPCKHCRGEEWQWGACTNPTKANADFIVKAVNNHDALVGALRFILAFYEPGQRYLDTEAWKVAEAGARRALKDAEGTADLVGREQQP